MEKDSALYQLMSIRMNGIMNGITNGEGNTRRFSEDLTNILASWKDGAASGRPAVNRPLRQRTERARLAVWDARLPIRLF